MPKLGRLPVIPDRPKLRFRDIRTGLIPHPASEDYLAGVSGWQMLGNDQYGDCVAVTGGNERYFVTSLLTNTPTYPTLQQVIDLYKTQNPLFPTQDNGMNIQLCLEYLNKVGWLGVQIVAFAAVDYTDPEETDAALATFGSLWTGITVSQANQQQFASGEPWDYDPASPIEGGHSVMTGGYDAASLKFITWAQETAFTNAYWDNQVEEAWIVIWPEMLGTRQFEAGIDAAKLDEYYFDLTGRHIPSAPPAPSGCLPSALRRLRR
jgi:hypothetical protein